MIEVTRERFTELYMSNTVKDLAKTLGVKPNQVSKTAKELGLSKPRGRSAKTISIVQ